MTSFITRNQLEIDENKVFIAPAEKLMISEPTESERYLIETIASSDDLSCTSYQLKSKIVDLHSEFHLSPKRANLVRAFDFTHTKAVLELGCGSGSLTRYLGEQGLRVDALEPNYHLAQAAVQRCGSMDKVRIAHADLSNMDVGEAEYDLVLCVGITECAQTYFPSESSEIGVQKILDLARRALKPNGVVLISEENRTGFKYTMGAHDDHTGRRYDGVHGYLDGRTHSFNRREWAQMLLGTKFEQLNILYPFPDYKFPTLLLSEEYTQTNQYAYNHLESIKSRDYLSHFDAQRYENLFWEAAVSAGTLGDYSNSFCFLLAHDEAAIEQFCLLDFAHLPGYTRNLIYSTDITKKRDETLTERTRLSPATLPSFNGITHTPVEKETFYVGSMLSVEWSRALLYQDDDFDLFKSLLQEYYQFLVDLKSEDEFNLNIDLLPSNIIVTSNGWKVIDKEWTSSWPIPVDLLIYRSILMFVANYRHLIVNLCERERLYSVWDLIKRALEWVGSSGEYQHISWLKGQDELFQKNTSDQFTPLDLNAALVPESHFDRPLISIFWRNKRQEYHVDRLVTARIQKDDSMHSMTIELPADVRYFRYLRLDPCSVFRKEAASFFRLSSIKVYAQKPLGERHSVWSLNSEDAILKEAHAAGMQAVNQEFGKGFQVIDYDAWLEFIVNSSRRLDESEHFVIEFDIRYPRSEEFLVARDRHLIAAEVYTDRHADIEMTLKTLRETQQELAAIKESTAWRRAVMLETYIDNRIKPGVRSLRAWLSNPVARTRSLLYQRRTASSSNIEQNTGVDTRGYEQWLNTRPEDYWASFDTSASRPTVSIIVVVYETSVDKFKQTLTSVYDQTYAQWELCIADDASGMHEIVPFLKTLSDPQIKISYRAESGGFSAASNSAAGLATGEYLVFLKHEDILNTHALEELMVAAVKTDAEFIYSDEASIDVDGHLVVPHFKPDFSPDNLLSQNYIAHMVMLKHSLFIESGGFRIGYEGAQDYDLFLRLTETAKKIHHLAKPLYHARMTSDSTGHCHNIHAGTLVNSKRALEDALLRREISADIVEANQPLCFRVKRHILGEPLVSIIVPFKDHPLLLEQAIRSILDHSTYVNFEIIGISNDTTTPSTYKLMQAFEAEDKRVKFYQYNEKFNFSYLVNQGVSKAKGDHIVLFNNDIQIISPDWIEALLEHSQREEVAVVGAKLLFPDNTVQHAGIGIGLGGCAGHLHLNFPAFHDGYFNRLQIVQNISAVTGALMMVSKEIYDSLGGFDEENFKVAFNDVDFCLKARRAKFLNIFTPYCQAYHHESKTRGYENTVQKMQRFEKEKALLIEKYQVEMDQGDPYYNANLNQGRDDFEFID